MIWLRRIWTWGSSLIVGVFVVGYLSTLLLHNTFRLFEDSPSNWLESRTSKVMSATATTQRWNMFAPNVGTLSYSPIVVIVFKDGRRVSLHSIVEPDMPGWTGSSPIPNDVEGEQRLYDWRFHIGDGRIRKFESNAAKSERAWSVLRTNYTRWRATRWLQAHPGRKKDVQRIELWRTAIRHPGYGGELRCDWVELLPLYPYTDDQWPVPVDPLFPLYRN